MAETAWKVKREARRLATQVRGLPRTLARLPGLLLGPALRRRHDRRKARLIRMTEGDVAQAEEIAILLIFQPDGVLGSTLHTLAHLAAHGIAPFVVSNAPLSETDRARLRPRAWRIMERPNFGYDFGGYRDGILHLLDSGLRPSRLFVLNDSIWFPLRDDSDLIDRARASEADLFGYLLNTRSRAQARQHLQSYFLRFDGGLLARPEFEAHWRGLFLSDHKDLVIRRCEIPMTDAFRRMGASIEARHAYGDGARALQALETPTLHAVLGHLAAIDAEAPPALLRHLSGATPDAAWRERVLEDAEGGRFDKYFLYHHPAVLLGVLDAPLLKKDRQAIYRAQRQALLAGGFDAGLAPPVRDEIRAWDAG